MEQIHKKMFSSFQDWILGNGTNEPEQKEDFISTDTFDGARAGAVIGAIQDSRETERVAQYALPSFLALIKILTLPVIVVVANLVCNRVRNIILYFGFVLHLRKIEHVVFLSLILSP